MTNDLDILATALYVKTDDLLRQAPHLTPLRPRVSIAPKLTDAELVTLARIPARPRCKWSSEVACVTLQAHSRVLPLVLSKNRDMSSRDVQRGATGNVGKRFWEALAEPERLDLRSAGTLRSCPAGAILFHTGDLSGAVLIILGGSVRVIAISAGGHERLLAVRGYGEIIGEVSAVWQVPRSAIVRPIDPVKILSIPRSAFMRTLRQFPAAAMN